MRTVGKPASLVAAMFVLSWACQGSSAQPPGSAHSPGPSDPPVQSAGAGPTNGNQGQRPSLAPLVDQVRPTVVGVTTRTEVAMPDDLQRLWRQFFGGTPAPGPQEETGIGSGVIIDPKGLVLTNNHVVADAKEVRVKTADGVEHRAAVKGTDPPTDLAVIQLLDVKERLPAARLGNSDALRVGDYVIAIGNPFGLDLTVTSGIISAKARTIGVGPYDEFLQTDAAINPGNSGGPLFDLKGEVVGINTAITSSGQGIGFAVPIELVEALLPQLESKGRVTRGYLGLSLQDLTPELARALGASAGQGAVVASVEPRGPAARAGLKSGDVVLAVDGAAVTSAAQLARLVALLPPGRKVEIKYHRDRATQVASATLTERPPQKETPQNQGGSGQQPDEDSMGLSLQPVPQGAVGKLGTERGALISEVKPGSRTSRAGLKSGDVIVEVNRKPVTSPGDFAAIAREAKDGPLLVKVLRRGSPLFLAISPPGS